MVIEIARPTKTESNRCWYCGCVRGAPAPCPRNTRTTDAAHYYPLTTVSPQELKKEKEKDA